MGIKKGDIQHLKTLRIASKPAQTLYEERKIDKFMTAEDIILKLLSTRPNAGLKLIEKYNEYKSAKGKTPGTKLKPPKVKPIIVEQITRCSLFVILYVEDTRKPEEEEHKYISASGILEDSGKLLREILSYLYRSWASNG